MSFVHMPVQLAGSLKSTHKLRECSKCGHQREPSGGIEMGPGRWICAPCWTRRAQKKRS